MTAEQPGLRQSLRAALKNRPFIFGAGIYLLTWISVDILQTALLFFLKYVLLREAQSDLIMASIFVTAIMALPLWEWASRHWNKRLAYIAGIAFWAVVQLVMVSLNPALQPRPAARAVRPGGHRGQRRARPALVDHPGRDRMGRVADR